MVLLSDFPESGGWGPGETGEEEVGGDVDRDAFEPAGDGVDSCGFVDDGCVGPGVD
jgi:hypothetical protein